MQELKLEDIEDVRVIVKIKGQHYSLIEKENVDDALLTRKAVLQILQGTHDILMIPLEKLKDD